MKTTAYSDRVLREALTNPAGLDIAADTVVVASFSPDGEHLQNAIVPRTANHWTIENGAAQNALKIIFPPATAAQTVARFEIMVGGETLYHSAASRPRDMLSGDNIVIHPGQITVEER